MIPIVDLAADDETVREGLRRAFEELGFVVVTGHGVGSDRLGAIVDAARAFFALAEDDKFACAPKRWNPNAANRYRGYFPSEVHGMEGLDLGDPGLDDSHAEQPSFYAEVVGDYRVQLVVNDGEDYSTPVFLDVSVELTTVNEPPLVGTGLERAVAHNTGGGLPGNLPRVLDGTVDAVVDMGAWEPPRIFAELQAIGGVADDEMARVFNLGVGMVLAVPASAADGVIATLAAHDRRARVIGELVAGSGQVDLRR